MNDKTIELLAQLIVTAHRLTRLAAQATGNSTPSAVWHTLSVLSTDGPLRIGELAAAARVSQPSMTKVVHQLGSGRLVHRIADTDDSRASQIAITEVGSTALSDWRAQLATALAPRFSDLSTPDQATLARAVEILSNRVAVERKVA
ncbi:MAG: MarR family transcriptional regulator [Terrimesophilobacter sp.]